MNYRELFQPQLEEISDTYFAKPSQETDSFGNRFVFNRRKVYVYIKTKRDGGHIYDLSVGSFNVLDNYQFLDNKNPYLPHFKEV
jgi:hypothetical protein